MQNPLNRKYWLLQLDFVFRLTKLCFCLACVCVCVCSGPADPEGLSVWWKKRSLQSRLERARRSVLRVLGVRPCLWPRAAGAVRQSDRQVMTQEQTCHVTPPHGPLSWSKAEYDRMPLNCSKYQSHVSTELVWAVILKKIFESLDSKP